MGAKRLYREKQLYNFYINVKLIEEVDKLIANSNEKYRNRSHFITLKFQEALEEEKRQR